MIRTLTKNGTTLDLLTYPYSPADGDAIDLGGVTRDWEAYGAPGMDAPRFGPTTTAVPRLMPFAVDVFGTDADDLAANRTALIAMLPDDQDETLVEVGATNGSYTATATARRVDGLVSSPYTAREDVGLVATVSFTLACDPYLTTATDTLYDAAATTLPAVVDMSAQTGDAPAPWDMLLDFDALEAVAFYAGRFPDESATIADFAVEAVDLSWSGGAAYTNANGWPDGVGNTVWRTDSATEVYADVDVTDFRPGEYLVVAKCFTTTVNTGTVRHAYCAPVPIPSLTLQLLALGVVTLPCAAVRGSASSTLRFYLAGDGTNYGYLNAVFFIPVSFGGAIWWQPASGHAHTLASEDETFYADDVAALGSVRVGRQIRGKGGALVMLAEQATPAATTAAALTLAYEPRWEQLPSA